MIGSRIELASVLALDIVSERYEEDTVVDCLGRLVYYSKAFTDWTDAGTHSELAFGPVPISLPALSEFGDRLSAWLSLPLRDLQQEPFAASCLLVPEVARRDGSLHINVRRNEGARFSPAVIVRYNVRSFRAEVTLAVDLTSLGRFCDHVGLLVGS